MARVLTICLVLFAVASTAAFYRHGGRGGFDFIRTGVPSSQFPALPEGETGIAANYPGDVGISADPNVLFSDTFESYTTDSELSGNWTNYFQAATTDIVTNVVNLGAKAVFQRMPNSGSEYGNAIIKAISPDRDDIYVRGCRRFASDYDGMGSPHNGIGVTANYPGPGTPPDGTDFMLVYIEQDGSIAGGPPPGYDHIYIYHPEMDDNYGGNWYSDGTFSNDSGPDGGYGPQFVSRAKSAPPRGSWFCRELYVKLNTPGLRDGRVAWWDDGVLRGDFHNIRFRDVGTVKIDQIDFSNGGQSSSQINDMWTDDIVVATSYIGPVTALPADTEDPTDPTSLVATTASSSQINLTWAASTDNVGVTGYNIERCSGAACVNFAQVDTAPSNSYNDTGLSASTVYRYRVQAYDAAANTSGYSNIDEATTDAGGGVVDAASCSSADVNAAFGQAQAGDTVNIPAGTCNWTTGVAWSPPANVSVIGAGDLDTVGGDDSTVIVDNYSNSNGYVLQISVPATGVFRLAGITFRNGTGGLKNTGPIQFLASGKGYLRFDHSTIDMTTGSSAGHRGKMLYIGGGVRGVIDNSELLADNINWVHFVNGRNDGNTEWSEASGFGTDDFLFIEDSIGSSTTNEGQLTDCHTGGKFVVRYTSFTHMGIGQTHPTGHASDDRGCRAHEIYGNTSVQGTGGDTTNYALDYNNSGGAMTWGNSCDDAYKNVMYFNNCRSADGLNCGYTQSNPPNGWGNCNLPDAGSTWDGVASAGECLDQPGRGQGDLLSGTFPNKINTRTGTVAEVIQASEPVYEWSNQCDRNTGYGGAWLNNNASSLIVENRDFFLSHGNTSCNPGAGACSAGVGVGTRAQRPANCTTGVAWWSTDQGGNWNTVNGTSNDGTLDKCTSTNTWTNGVYTPYTFPHPLRG